MVRYGDARYAVALVPATGNEEPVPFSLPDDDVVAAIDAPPTPLTSPSPDDRSVLLLHYESHPPITMLARPWLGLAGVRIDPVIGARQRTRRFTGMSILDATDGTEHRLALRRDAQVSLPAWAPGGQRFAFTIDEADGVGLWVVDRPADPVQVPGVRVCAVLGADPPALGGAAHWSRDGRTLLVLGAVDRQPAVTPVEPRISETAGKRSQMATYQDLLTSAADEDAFEALATSVPVRVDPGTGTASTLGPAGLYQFIDESPDGSYLLVHRLQRPFSFRVPYYFFARRVEVWSRTGALVRVVADLPVSDQVPRMGVPSGPRGVSWDERAPARLIWTEALDGGDPVAPAEYRDAIWHLDAPFDAEPKQAFKVVNRCLGWSNLDQPGALLLTEHDRDRRWVTTWRCELTAPERNRVVFDLAEDDAYADPGSPMMRLHPDGSRTLRQDGDALYLRGAGATPDGDRPFLDRRDLADGSVTRLFQSAADAHESVLSLTGGTGGTGGSAQQAVIWRETRAEPPNLWVVALGDGGVVSLGDSRVASPGGGRSEPRRLTRWPDPHPALTGMTRQLITTDRGDGVQLSGMLYLPRGYDGERDGPLALLIWAYPMDYGDQGTAGQVRAGTRRFKRLTGSDPAWFVRRGYAVLADATMPVIGDPETKNDSYVEQVIAAAAAHIGALAARGVADPQRVAMAGHSYGAFLTATLLAHTDLFAAGIARSGAYNRTLTPFGFQTERRSFWEVPQVYDQVSPFRFADKIRAPLLLIHGDKDANSGTFCIQSERMFQAIEGNGGTARLVILPCENHGYLARESVLHVLAEQFAWLERWLGPGYS
jgi:dipeptidyl aminopeptidase/acylaminoacyl peptidase